jgi:hypothetical protein
MQSAWVKTLVYIACLRSFVVNISHQDGNLDIPELFNLAHRNRKRLKTYRSERAVRNRDDRVANDDIPVNARLPHKRETFEREKVGRLVDGRQKGLEWDAPQALQRIASLRAVIRGDKAIVVLLPVNNGGRGPRSPRNLQITVQSQLTMYFVQI